MTPSEWIRHRKLRKKIASAKWYILKKQRQLEEQRAIQQHRLAEQLVLREQKKGWIWPDVQLRDEWYAVNAHLSWGYPSRRVETEDAAVYRAWCEFVERDIDNLRGMVEEVWPDRDWSEWLYQTWVVKIIRQMAIRELRCIRETGVGPFDSVELPMGPFEHPRQHGHLWTTSVWFWIWIMTHLGNHREEFDTVWCHLHHHGLRTTQWVHTLQEFLASSVSLNHWLDRMSQNIRDHIEAPEETGEDVSTTTSTTGDGEENVSPSPSYLTQPPTPQYAESDEEEEALFFTDSDSESIPSSLDTFLFETFNTDPVLLS